MSDFRIPKRQSVFAYPQIGLCTLLRVMFLINYTLDMTGVTEMGWIKVWFPYVAAFVLDVLGMVAFEIWRKVLEEKG